MSWILWALSLSSATPTAAAEAGSGAVAPPVACDVHFRFVGQPACVTLSYDDGRTQVDNGCDGPILVDQSVQSGAFRPVPAGGSLTIKDLSAFTLGHQGTLYRAVARVEEVCAE